MLVDGSVALHLWSDALEPGGRIPVRFTADGENVSPPLRWANVPSHARELALVFEQLGDTEGPPVVHWIVWRIPPRLDGLPESFRSTADPRREGAEVLEGMNALDHVGYDGPEPPDERERSYRFRLLALDAPLEMDHAPDPCALGAAIQGHVVDQAELTATYATSDAPQLGA
jgi:Raf kinase inhibitor-like YbhB/YbcL family protein